MGATGRFVRSPPLTSTLVRFPAVALLFAAARGAWLQDGGSANRSSVSYEFGCAAQGFVNAWSFLTSSNINSGVIVTDNGTVFAQAFDGNVYAIQASGAQLWMNGASASTTLSSAPCYDNATGLVFTGNNDNKLYAYWAHNGSIAWTFLVAGNIQSSPALYNRTLYITVISPSNVYALSFNTTRATLLWSNALSSGATYTSPAVSPTDGAVFQGCDDNFLYKLNGTNGVTLWKTAVGTTNIRSDAAMGPNNTVVAADAGGKVFALNATSGVRVWVTDLGVAVYSSPAIANGFIYIGCRDNYVYALNASSGSIAWRYLTNANVDGKVAVGGDGSIYVGNTLGTIVALNSSGRLIGSFDTSGSVIGRPAIGADGLVYWGSVGDNKVYMTRTCCQRGYFCPGGVLTAARLCPAGSACPLASITPTLCPPGTFSNTGASSCTPCFGGTFAPTSNTSSCQECPPGHFCPAGSTTWSDKNCGRGNYCPWRTATPFSCGPFGAVDAVLGPANGPAFMTEVAACKNHCYFGAPGELSTCG